MSGMEFNELIFSDDDSMSWNYANTHLTLPPPPPEADTGVVTNSVVVVIVAWLPGVGSSVILLSEREREG